MITKQANFICLKKKLSNNFKLGNSNVCASLLTQYMTRPNITCHNHCTFKAVMSTDGISGYLPQVERDMKISVILTGDKARGAVNIMGMLLNIHT